MAVNFIEYSTEVRHQELIPLPKEDSSYGVEAISCFGLILYALIMQRNFRDWKDLFRTLFSIPLFDKSPRTVIEKRRHGFLRMFMYFILIIVNFILLLYACFRSGFVPNSWTCINLGGGTHSITEILSFCLYFVFGYFVFKFIVIFLLSKLFEEDTFGRLLMHLDIYYNLALLFFSMPLLFVVLNTSGFFAHILLYFILGLTFIVSVFKFLRILIIGKQNSKFSHLHIFLYLCALEIVPILSLWKLFFIILPCK